MEQQEEAAPHGGKEEEELLLQQFERILDHDPLIDEVGFLHPTQLQSLRGTRIGNTISDSPEFDQRFFWCRDHKLAISAKIIANLYRAAHHAHSGARTAQDALVASADLMRHSKALLILCPDFLSAWNSRKMVLAGNYILKLLMDELQLCALILSYSPKSESTWSHRRWVIKKVAEKHEDVAELIEKESVLVKEIAEKSKMNYRAWRHRCWLIPFMTRKQVLDELKKSTRWNELHVADNCCFHFRRSLLLALLDGSCHVENGEDSFNWMPEVRVLWKEELRWNELLIRRHQGREALWAHRRFLSQCWIQRFLTSEETCPSTENSGPTTSLLELFLAQEIYLLSDCLNAPGDEFDDTRIQAQLAALYIMWISKRVPVLQSKLEQRLHSVGSLKDILARTCPEKTMAWMHLLEFSSE